MEIRTWQQEQQMVRDACASLPHRFGLRAFPGKLFRTSARKSFVAADGQVQVVVQVRGHEGRCWLDFSRDTVDAIRRELAHYPSGNPA